nr:hypothetical protein [Kocuria sp. JC486]
MVLGGLSLLAGSNAGLVRLGLWAPVDSDRIGDLHGPVMVLGFLGTVISLERAQAMRHPLALLAPALLGLGSVLLILGAPVLLGKLLVVEGAVAFLTVMIALWRRTRADLVATQVTGALLLALGAGLGFTTAVPNLLPVLVAFLVVTIASERAELAQLSIGPRAIPTLLLITSALSLAATSAVLWPDLGARLLGAVCLLTAVWLTRNDVGRRMIRTSGFRRFNAAALLAGNLWLAVAGLTWMIAGRPETTGTYDLVIHGVFLGFAFSMIMAHAPTIFPAVLGRPLPYRSVMWGPLVILHLGMLYRAMGDVVGVDELWQTGGVIAVVGILLFAVTAVLSVARSGERSRSGRRRTSTTDANGGRDDEDDHGTDSGTNADENEGVGRTPAQDGAAG